MNPAAFILHLDIPQWTVSPASSLVVTLLYTLLLLISSTMAEKENKQLQAVIQGNGQFTKELYSILAKKSPEKNVFFSPISAHAVLSMAYQGSKGSTHEAFSKALNLPDTQLAAEGYHAVISKLNNIENVQLLMANKVYVMEGHALKENFKNITAEKFLSEVESVNFAESAVAAKSINTWAEGKTNNKIKDLISPDDLDSLTRLVLVNAIYFKGNWASKFDPKRTQTEKFYLNNNDSIDVQMMNNKNKYFYKEDEALDAKVLELPYSNPEVSLIVILPNKRNGIAELEQKLANTDLTKITENMFKPEVIVKLPKFKIETTIDLNQPLTELGLGVIFNSEADFSELLESPEPLYVSKVVQKAFIEVNEEGTEAAAATALQVNCLQMLIDLPAEPKEFKADHPFVVLLKKTLRIVDLELQVATFTDTLLFQGRVHNPLK